MMQPKTPHRAQILDQFTRQAALFQQTHRTAESALKLMLSATEPRADDEVLDVACGPGVVACALAEVARHVTGIDITPTMLEHARALQATRGLSNVDWQLGDVEHLPFDEGSFSFVISRYAIHHLQDPQRVVAEMARVCRRGGRVTLIDSAPTPDKADAFNATERMRDPSHTAALTPAALQALLAHAGLQVVRSQMYAWEVDAQGLINRSFPLAGDAERLRALYESDVGTDRIGMNARYVGNALHVTFPTLILVAVKSAA
jgi:ubiquinone/menaquinone biosynthesis C-methylase UbiE